MGKRLVVTLVVLALTLAAMPQVVQGGTGMPLSGNVWQWQQTLLSDGTLVTVKDSSRYTVEFLPGGMLAIKADCNRVLGTYQAMDGRVTLTLGPSTLVACPPDSQADVFVQQLTNVNEYLFVGTALFLNIKFDSGGMRFVALENTKLVETAWTAQSFLFRGGLSTPLIGTQPTIQFSADGRVSGSTGCNRFTGPYQVSGDTLTIGLLATTRMACSPDIAQQEQEYLNALNATKTYRIVGKMLTLYSSTPGSRTAEFVAP